MPKLPGANPPTKALPFGVTQAAAAKKRRLRACEDCEGYGYRTVSSRVEGGKPVRVLDSKPCATCEGSGRVKR